ncbi:MAG TPA: hypothetical protein VFS08_07280 [Gemmatimonadaceae bacterium]|nr:hypothetical protein [Gemmatimonadaceae bacterium]
MPGIYVLHSMDAASLPMYQADISLGETVLAETLFVSSPTSYRVAGAYVLRFVGEVYEERGPLEATRDPSTGGVALVGVLRSRGGVARRHGDSLVVELDAIGGTSHRLVYVASPAPPPPGPVASLQLSLTDTVALPGERLDLRPLVVRGLDASGRWIRDPALIVEAPAGWATAGDTLVAPAAPTVGVAHVRSGDAVAEVEVQVVPDLRESRWRLTWRCLEPFDLVPDAVTRIGDSSAVELVVDSVRYAPASVGYGSDFPFVYSSRIGPILWAKAALYARGTETVWFPDRTTTDSVRYALPVLRQWADSIQLAGPHYSYEIPRYPVALPREESAARTYAATPTTPGMCDDLSYVGGGPVRFEPLP